MTTEPKQAMPVEVPPSEEAAIEEQQSLLERDMEKAFTSRSCDWFRGWEAHEAVSRPQPPSTSAVEAEADMGAYHDAMETYQQGATDKCWKLFLAGKQQGHARATVKYEAEIAGLKSSYADQKLRAESWYKQAVELETERDALQKENERLKALVGNAIAEIGYEKHDGDCDSRYNVDQKNMPELLKFCDCNFRFLNPIREILLEGKKP